MNKNLTEVVFLLDRSGSMAGLEEDTIGGFNGFVKRQSELEGKTLVTTVLFDDRYELLWQGAEAEEVNLTEEEYYVRGCTALLDAVGKTIVEVGQRLARTPEDSRPGSVIFAITTDGMENASREFTYEKIKKMIQHQREKYNWEFIFMGANIDAADEADHLGISAENAYDFEATETGVEKMYAKMNEAVSEIRGKY
ncbi:VWA domain-containing protein [Bacillus salacetis]|uniref:VWA domain-containing protein n=1 Tax=Bacillus salacetis TaxID=2315464 RepID=A0A3A1QPJ7_9BACI|nr:vWA domain-containing protein [Bacillus salacetis]RIW27807.1 VWA domain-containing protein [Bacillus salacetis]